MLSRWLYITKISKVKSIQNQDITREKGICYEKYKKCFWLTISAGKFRVHAKVCFHNPKIEKSTNLSKKHYTKERRAATQDKLLIENTRTKIQKQFIFLICNSKFCENLLFRFLTKASLISNIVGECA